MKLYRSINLYRDYLILFIVIFVSLLLITSNENKQIEQLKIWMVGLFGVVQQDWVLVHNYLDLKEKNEQLLLENTILALENSAMHEMRLENKRLRELIGFRKASPYRLIAARVIGSQKKGFINDITLDVGQVDGVQKNMPLVTPAGLVGKLYLVRKTRSHGQLLLDQNFRAGAIVQRSRVRGVVSWKEGEFCQLNEVPKRSDVKIGDWVVTSGFSDIFPPGLRIGEVISISESPRGMFMNIKIKPAVDFNKLEEVLVVGQK